MKSHVKIDAIYWRESGEIKFKVTYNSTLISKEPILSFINENINDVL